MASNEGLRRILYCSEAVMGATSGVPSSLSSIVINGRRYNARHHITGILSYRDGLYLQVLEGQHDVLERLYARIGQDPRHRDVVTLLDEPITQRSFGNWALKLSASSSLGAELIALIERKRETIRTMGEPRGLKLLNTFHDISSLSTGDFHVLPPLAQLGDFELSLNSLPDFEPNEADLHQHLELCGRLLGRPTSFAELRGHDGLDDETLYGRLTRYCRDGVLEITRTRKRARAPRRAAATSSFYAKLRTFFGNRART